MNVLTALRLTGFLVLASSTLAAAQSPTPAHTWSRGSTLGGFGGVAVDSSGSGAVAGGAVGWEVTPRFGIEGRGAWLYPGDAEAFAAELSAHVNLVRARPVVPFVKGGIGLYRASYDAASDDVPDFYLNRFATDGTGVGPRQTFTDPSFIAGAGINFFVSRHVAIRPEVQAMVVWRDSNQHIVTAVTMHAVFHFEEHTITPSQRGQ